MNATTTAPHQHSNCLRCGRSLRSAKSMATGYGPTCTRKVKAAAKAEIVAQYKPHQVAKAEELIEQGALIPLRRGIYLAPSSDGAPHLQGPPHRLLVPRRDQGRPPLQAPHRRPHPQPRRLKARRSIQ